MRVRPETSADFARIRQVNAEAFKNHQYSRQTEHLIVEALRDAGALEISLVAEEAGEVLGHVAFSRAAIGDASCDWYLLGPIAVWPGRQGQGIGRALVEAGIAELRERGAQGCALVGDPAFYGRFGFRHQAGVFCPGVPDEYVLCLPLSESGVPTGELAHHDAFMVEPEGTCSDG